MKNKVALIPGVMDVTGPEEAALARPLFRLHGATCCSLPTSGFKNRLVRVPRRTASSPAAQPDAGGERWDVCGGCGASAGLLAEPAGLPSWEEGAGRAGQPRVEQRAEQRPAEQRRLPGGGWAGASFQLPLGGLA